MTTYDVIRSNKRKSVFLIAIFFLLILLIGWAVSVYEGSGSAYGIIFFAALFSIISALIGYYGGARIALTANSAQEIQKEDNPYLYRMVENLCIATGLPTPRVYIISDPSINAFATGRDPQHAHIAVTAGALEKLENEELEGVLAHELSHIQNYDIRFLTLVVVLVGTIVLLADVFFRFRIFGGRRGGRSEGAGLIFAAIALALLILSPIIAQLIKLAISRKREYLADASGVLVTRYPQGLANALRKIQNDGLKMQHVSNATAHLFLSNPFGATKSGGMAKLFSTHPPIEDRIMALEQMAGGPQE
ncbi:MAG: zinc metalloprotease HtpX [Candidatus Kerfeldbacteria bacterium CG08_land_8_20_14_0_20_42_7]|uniref:Protease HtpX homolog n=1 Tax=Candidatus Kerfeldbacteria bacterium CG08_land_8_20_14_0_20_42_7 TaxID=2014245 RepID=A0A2H0YTR5_9BACT|nr:MAG: zinc metalloprotease HtpX [Candidatus Kerfeldbacteria bacterium CG08_land_8_20_14_0_20_42_7]